MAAQGQPEWMWGETELKTASSEKRLRYILELQERMQSYEDDIEELRELVHFMLDMQAGFADDYVIDNLEQIPADD